ncbi:MAG: heavy-metal-associated domain-containing protein [Planctomycetota bacterium]
MRTVVYAVAAIAAIGIMVGIASMPVSDDSSADESVASATVSANPQVIEEAGTLTMAVPTMHCEFACFPKVKETLEGIEGVDEVVLDTQKEEGVLDNRQVVVTHQAGFDLSAAIGKLADRGYKNADRVQ